MEIETNSQKDQVQDLQNQIIELQGKITDLQLELDARYFGLYDFIINVHNSLEKIVDNKLYQIAFYLYRLKTQLLHGNVQDKKQFFRWLFHRATPVDEQSFPNPLKKAYSDISIIKHSYFSYSPPKEDPNGPVSFPPQTILQLRTELTANYPFLKRSLLFNHFEAETLWMDHCEQMKTNSDEIKTLQKLMDDPKIKGIVVYPAVIAWEPFQTPQQLMISFAKNGYLALFCERPGTLHKKLVNVQENLWIVPEDVLLRSVGNREVTVFVTWLGSIPLVNHIPNRKIWYHILDKLDIFSLYSDSYLAMHYHFIQQCDYVSYVAKALLNCIPEPEKAIYLPNACHAEDLIRTLPGSVPMDMQPIVDKQHPIIGYFGWIDSWMDFKTLEFVATQRPDYEFVFIGPRNENSPIVTSGIERLKKLGNFHFLGQKKYQELPSYARRFTVATIAFEINEMMDCVSPIKFYEYCAYGLPSISSDMPEMEQFSSDFVACYRTQEEYLALLDRFTTKEVTSLAKEKAPAIALENTWDSRVKQMIQEWEA